MKAIYKSIIAAVAVTPLLTSCLEETFPNNSVSQEQLEQSPAATAALVQGMHSNMLKVWSLGSTSRHYDFGYPAIMHIRDVMTDDMAVAYANGYDWFGSWSANMHQSSDYIYPQFCWNIYYGQVLICNKAIKAIDPQTENPELQYYLAAAYAYRAMTYLEAASIWECLPVAILDGTSPDGKNVLGLTIPIVTEKTTEAESRNNPRATHEKMFQFIKTDLENAISLMEKTNVGPVDKTLPSLAVAYGLLARTYLWDASFLAEGVQTAAPADDVTPEVSTSTAAQQYEKAAEYARTAINVSGATPLTQDEWSSTSRGFNDMNFSSWMWGLQLVAENSAVKTAIVNWTSFICNETEFGYASAGALVSVGSGFYDRINNNDFRKLSFVAPEDSPLHGREQFVSNSFAENYLQPYNAIKFRPGSGVMTDHNVGAAVAIPLMRVEEMYFIEAEATAHNNPSEGNKLLTQFMKSYRYGTYFNKAEGEAEVVDEIIFQKRVELWGEGRNFFDVKRLNMSVERRYDGSNFDPSRNTFNTQGRPAWMTFVITDQEVDNNVALKNFNNTTSTGLYQRTN